MNAETNPRTPHQALQARERLGRAFIAAGGSKEWWAGSRDLAGVIAHDVLTQETVTVPPSDADPDVTVTHSIADGTVADFAKNAEIFAIFRRAGFLFVRSLGVVRRQASVGTAIPTAPFGYIAKMLHDKGFKVAFDIELPEASGLSSAVRAARERRAEYFRERGELWEGRAEHHGAKSDAAYLRSHAAVAGIPMGQPILVGHHSEKRHRRDIERSRAAMGASVEASRKEAHAESVAASHEHAARRVEHVDTKVMAQQRASLVMQAVSRGVKREAGAVRISEGHVYFPGGQSKYVRVGGSSWSVGPWMNQDNGASLQGSYAPTDDPVAVAADIFAALRQLVPRAEGPDYLGYLKKKGKKLLDAVAQKGLGADGLMFSIGGPVGKGAYGQRAPVEVEIHTLRDGYRAWRHPYYAHHSGRKPIVEARGTPEEALDTIVAAVNPWAAEYLRLKLALKAIEDEPYSVQDRWKRKEVAEAALAAIGG